MKIYRNPLLITSTATFVLAGILATTFHELSHLIAGLVSGQNGRLYPNAVEFVNQTNSQHIITASTGPLFSLLAGALIVLLIKPPFNSYSRLLVMWTGFLSAQIGFGYFVIAPFTQTGDTGAVLKALHAPSAIYYLSFAIGVAGMIWLAKKFASYAVPSVDGIQNLRKFGLQPWLIGTGILMVGYMFATRHLHSNEQLVALAGVATIGIFTPMQTFFFNKYSFSKDSALSSVSQWGLGISMLAVIAVAVL